MKAVLNRFFGRLTIEHLWALVALAGVFIFLNLHPIRPHDFWWHMAVGREVVTTGQIPTVDAYSLTQQAQPYPSYSMFWLMEVYFYRVYSLGGPALVVFGHSLMVGTAYAILLYLCWKKSGSWRIAAVSVLFAAALGINDWNVRPQAVSFLIGAVYLLAIYKLQVGEAKKWLLVFPLGMLIWANSHGSFFIGLVLIGLWLGQEAWAAWRGGEIKGMHKLPLPLQFPLLALLATGLAALLNPRGFGILSYLAGMLASTPVQKLVLEWAAPGFDTLGGRLFLGGLILCALVLVFSPKHPTIFQWMTFLFFAGLGLKTLRGAVWFGMVLAPALAEHLKWMAGRLVRTGKRSSTTPPMAQIMNAVLAGMVLLSVLVTLPWFKESLPLPELKRRLIAAETPVEATRFLLENQLPSPIFHDMAYGSYLIWTAQPDYPVFVDSRIELYPYEHWEEYLNTSQAGNEWESSLEQYGIQTLILDKLNQTKLIQAASETTRWNLVYEDGESVIFINDMGP